MAKKKQDQTEASTENHKLVRKVDEMLSTEPLPALPLPEPPKDGLKEKILSIKSTSKDEAPKDLAEALKGIKLDDQPPEELHNSTADVTEESAESPKNDALPASEERPASELTEPRTKQPLSTNLDDKETDKAVDEIAAKEGDTILALEDAKTESLRPPAAPGWRAKLKALVGSKWFKIIFILLVIGLFALPATRYAILGTVIKRPVTLQVIDSKTNLPVNEALVAVGGQSAQTDAQGKVSLSAKLGNRQVSVSKQYYAPAKQSYFVGFTQAEDSKLLLTATGRLVPITVQDKITGKPVVNASVKVLNTTAKTDAKGKAVVALPVKAAKYEATVVAANYNQLKATLELTEKAVAANNLALVPAGQLYFLSNATGKIDVVKANLDGSNRKTVVEGTGREESVSTSLLASRDWRYLVLKARRDNAQASLYLIDTATDKISQFDSTNADFTLIGWYDHSFIYSMKRNDQSDWQAGTRLIKSYDAERQQLSQLDQSQAEGSSAGYAYQEFAQFYILPNALTYTTQWVHYAKGDIDISSKTDTIRAVQPNGQNKKDYQSFPAAANTTILASLSEPQEVYYSVYTPVDGKTAYYEFENQAIKPANLDSATFNKAYPTYLLSPTGRQTFWSELRDGKNSLFIGGPNAESKKEIASLTDYTPYGWYGENYTLVAKNGSELSIMPASGLAKDKQPLKVTDYYKPAQTYLGYGYGYGGL